MNAEIYNDNPQKEICSNENESKAYNRVIEDTRRKDILNWQHAVRISIDEPVLRSIKAHALSNQETAVGGIYIGEAPKKEPSDIYSVRFVDALSAKGRSTLKSFTFTQESWRDLNTRLEERSPDNSLILLGWYLSFPGSGLYLSGSILHIHHNYFDRVFHTCFLMDPIEQKMDFYSYDRRKLVVLKYDFPWPEWAQEW